jgi:aerobic C4-dicarboxylate transport protein
MKSADHAGATSSKGIHRVLYVQVLCGLAAGVVIGHLWPAAGVALKPLGDGFVKLMRMMISPIVFCTITGGISSLRDRAQIGKTLLKAVGLFYALTALALLTGLVAVYLLHPGAGLDIDPSTLDPSVAAQYAATAGASDPPQRSALLRAPAEPGLSSDSPPRSALLRAPAEPGLSSDSPPRSALLRAPAEPGLSSDSPPRSALLRAPAEPGLSIDSPQRSALLRAPAEPGLSIDSPQRSALLRAPAEPGLSIDPPQRSALLRAPAEPGLSSGVAEFVLHMIPSTFFGAFTEHAVLPVLLIAGLVGFALVSVGRRGEPIARGIDALSAVLFAIFGFLVKLAPLGAFGAVAFTVGRYGVGSLASLGWLIATFYVACLFFVLVVLGLVARLHGFSLWKLLRYTREELLIVLGTSATEPVLPRLLAKLEQLGCNKGVVGLVLPAGYSFNLSGTAIYLSLATVFLAQAMNIDLPPSKLLLMLLVMLLTSKGAAGVSGSGFVALVATLTAIPGVPVAAVAIIVGVDRFMSEARALASCASNTVAVVVVSMWGRACDRAVLERELDGPSGPGGGRS